jgi:HK97 family phage prohead protease
MTRSAPAAAADRRGAPPPSRGNRDASFVPATYDAQAHTVEVVLSAGTRVQRWYGFEELLIDPGAVNIGRVAAGLCNVLDSHDSYEIDAILGQVQAVRFENGALVGVIKFGASERAVNAEAMVARGELRGISIGYGVSTWVVTETIGEMDVYQAAKWELLEVSFVSVPADASAGVRSAVPSPSNPSANSGGANEETDDMHTRSAPGAAAPAPAAAAAPAATPAVPEAVRAVETPAPAATPAAAPAAPATPATGASRFDAVTSMTFMDQARSFGLETEARTLVEQNARGEVGCETARERVLQLAAERQRAGTVPALSGARGTDADAAAADAIVEAIVARATRRAPSERAREFMGHRLLELAVLRTPGLNPRERDAQAILRAANATGDFPNLLANAGNKILLARYGTASPSYQAIAGRRDLRDFKSTKLLRIGDFPTLQPYTENGEIKSGTIGESGETVILGSYGRVLRLTRQAIVNDDLGAFDQMFANIGVLIGLFENATFYAMKSVASGLGPTLSDSKTVFHAGHNNYTSSGSAISVTSLGVGRASIRKQKNMDGNSLNLSPSILFVGADKETEADQAVAAVTPRNASDVNPFGGKLTVVTEGSITGNAWELYADPSFAPVWSYGYLQDAPGPRVFSAQETGFDGMSWQVTEDFYAGAIDFRGGYRNAGA